MRARYESRRELKGSKDRTKSREGRASSFSAVPRQPEFRVSAHASQMVLQHAKCLPSSSKKAVGQKQSNTITVQRRRGPKGRSPGDAGQKIASPQPVHQQDLKIRCLRDLQSDLKKLIFGQGPPDLNLSKVVWRRWDWRRREGESAVRREEYREARGATRLSMCVRVLGKAASAAGLSGETKSAGKAEAGRGGALIRSRPVRKGLETRPEATVSVSERNHKNKRKRNRGRAGSKRHVVERRERVEEVEDARTRRGSSSRARLPELAKSLSLDKEITIFGPKKANFSDTPLVELHGACLVPSTCIHHWTPLVLATLPLQTLFYGNPEHHADKRDCRQLDG
ncbi:hypothetical protein K438DRAFT_1766979 [Mycena galopus ATCC 62051]|nr:hypothetical protein K438DRAFT_1766979 [Mycena galopus ATCC 62051]